MVEIKFNSDEIFEIAEQIERNGAEFYRRASKLFEDAPNRDTFLELARMEEEHEKTFADLRDTLSAGERVEQTFDPENQAALYLQAVANGKIFNLDEDPSALINENSRVEDILTTAIGLEKESIVFYVGIKEVVPVKLGKDRINDIINQEVGHVVLLRNKLDSL